MTINNRVFKIFLFFIKLLYGKYFFSELLKIHVFISKLFIFFPQLNELILNLYHILTFHGLFTLHGPFTLNYFFTFHVFMLNYLTTLYFTREATLLITSRY